MICNKLYKIFFVSCAVLGMTLPAMAALDTATLEKNITERFNATRPDGYPEITQKDVKVLENQALNIRGIPLYAARVEITIANPTNKEEPPVQRTITIAVNEAGTVQFDNIGDVATAIDLVSPQAQKLMKLDIPNEKTAPAIQGTGKRVLRMISDPYCIYCREGFKWAQANTEKFKTFHVDSFPLPGNLGSEAVVWLLNSLNQTSPEDYRMVIEYAYTDLPPILVPDGTDLSNMNLRNQGREAALKNIIERFPDVVAEKDVKVLLARLEKEEMENQKNATIKLAEQGITSTPIFKVDDVPLRGFHAPTLEIMLKDDKTKEAFFQK